MKRCEWYPDGKTRCQNEAALQVYVVDVECPCPVCQESESGTFWVCLYCAKLAPAHWEKMGVEAHF